MQTKQMELDLTLRGNQFWLIDRILERLPDPPSTKQGKNCFSKASAISVLVELDKLAYQGGYFTANAIASKCGFTLPRKGQHDNVRRILNWYEALGVVAIVRSTKGGHQAIEARPCFSQMDAIINGNEPFGVVNEEIVSPEPVESPDDGAKFKGQSTALQMVPIPKDHCASNLEPLCGKPGTVVRQTRDRCASDAQPLIKQLKTLRTEDSLIDSKCAKPKPATQPSPADRSTARWMLEQIRQQVDPKARDSTERWAETIRLLRERDGRSDEEIRQLFELARNDNFWKKNVLSPESLRRHWVRLLAELQPQKNSPSKPFVQRPPKKAGRRESIPSY